MVRARWRGDGNGVDVRIFQRLLDPGMDGDVGIESRQFGKPRRVAIDNASDSPFFRGVKVANQIGAPVARSYYCSHELRRHDLSFF
jgi:hypothetical protein